MTNERNEIKEVRNYNIETSTGAHVRTATLVEFSNGRVIKFTEKMSKRSAISQALEIVRKETVEAIRELMTGWNKIEASAKAQFPNASKAELYEITAGAMNHALGH